MEKRGQSGSGIASFVLGLLSVIACCIGPVAVLFAFIGLVLAIVGMANSQKAKGMAIAGLVLSIIGLISGIIVTVLLVIAIEEGTYSISSSNVSFEELIEVILYELNHL